MTFFFRTVCLDTTLSARTETMRLKQQSKRGQEQEAATMRRQKTTEATKARRLQAKEDAATERRQRKDLEAEKEAAMYPSDEADRLQAKEDAATMRRQKTTEARRQPLEKESSAQPVAAAGEQGDNATPAEMQLIRRALVAQINARRSIKPRKDKNESDHPSLTRDA